MAKYVDRKSDAAPICAFEYRPGRIDDLINYLGDDLHRLEYNHPRGEIEAITVLLARGGKRLLRDGDFLVPAVPEFNYVTMRGDDFRSTHRRVGIAGECYLKVGEPFEAVQFLDDTILETIALALTHPAVHGVSLARTSHGPKLTILQHSSWTFDLFAGLYLIRRDGALSAEAHTKFDEKYTKAPEQD